MLSANCANWRELFLSYTAPHSFWLLEAGAKIGRRKSRNRTRRRNRLPCLCYPRIARIGANYSFLTPRRIPSGCSRQVLRSEEGRAETGRGEEIGFLAYAIRELRELARIIPFLHRAAFLLVARGRC